MKLVLAGCAFISAVIGQSRPDLAAQREAMQKLAFLAGKWSGEVSLVSEGAGPRKIRQTEDVQFKLDGLVLLVEGTGRDPENGTVVFNALATIFYDEAAKAYRFRAYTGGRYLDTELKVEPRGFEWGFTAGPATIRNIMRLNDKGEWSEITEVTIGGAPARRTMDMLVRKQ